MKLKKGDNIIMSVGRDKGKKGKISKVIPKEDKILVEGINLVKKHQKPKKANEKGVKLTMPYPFKASKAMLLCPSCNKATRVGYKIFNNSKVRFCKKCKSEFN